MSQKEKPRQGIATTSGAEVALAVEEAVSQKEKPRQGIATITSASFRPRALTSRKKKSPVRGLQHQNLLIQRLTTYLQSQKEKPRQGIATTK